jgi:hypothetical protein
VAVIAYVFAALDAGDPGAWAAGHVSIRQRNGDSLDPQKRRVRHTAIRIGLGLMGVSDARRVQRHQLSRPSRAATLTALRSGQKRCGHLAEVEVLQGALAQRQPLTDPTASGQRSVDDRDEALWQRRPSSAGLASSCGRRTWPGRVPWAAERSAASQVRHGLATAAGAAQADEVWTPALSC